MTNHPLILGIDPGLRHTGWGLVVAADNRLRFVAAGRINPPADQPMATRLSVLARELAALITTYAPDEAAVEETFVNSNARAALRLGQARGVALLVPAQAGLPVAEYAANLIKKSVTGQGHADKQQVETMVRFLLGGHKDDLVSDASDALAIAICHAHHRASRITHLGFSR